MQKAVIPREEAARRAAQSRRDKQKARGMPAKKWYVETSGVKAGPVAIDKFAAGSGKRSKKWFLETSDFSAGPVKIGKLGMGSDRRAVSDTVGSAPRSNNIQMVMPRIRSEMGGPYDTRDILYGTELLSNISTGATGALVGDVLARILINPSNFPKTRVAQFAPLYVRYRFRKLAFQFKPIASTFTAGQLIGYGDYDVDNLVSTDTPDNINIAAAHMGQRICQLWEEQTFPFGVMDSFTTLFTSLTAEESRLIYQGVFYLMAASTLPPNTALGNLYIAYELELYCPQVAITDIQQQALLSIAASGNGTPSAAIWSAVPTLTSEFTSNVIYGVTNGAGASTVTLSGLGLGQYLLSFTGHYGPALVGVSFGMRFANELGITIYDPPMASAQDPTGAGADKYMVCEYLCEVTSSGVSFEVSNWMSSNQNATTVTMRLVSLGALSLARPPLKHVAPILMDHGRLIKDAGEKDVEQAELSALKQQYDGLFMSLHEEVKALKKLSGKTDQTQTIVVPAGQPKGNAGIPVRLTQRWDPTLRAWIPEKNDEM